MSAIIFFIYLLNLRGGPIIFRQTIHIPVKQNNTNLINKLPTVNLKKGIGICNEKERILVIFAYLVKSRQLGPFSGGR